jgi:hypothetical protein
LRRIEYGNTMLRALRVRPPVDGTMVDGAACDTSLRIKAKFRLTDKKRLPHGGRQGGDGTAQYALMEGRRQTTRVGLQVFDNP